MSLPTSSSTLSLRLHVEFYTTESGVMHRGSTYPLEHMQNVVVDLSGQANISPQISPNISPNETP